MYRITITFNAYNQFIDKAKLLSGKSNRTIGKTHKKAAMLAIADCKYLREFADKDDY